MWQSDIFTFRLGGRQAYLIAFLDDYSRFVTGLGMYRSQTAEAVLEVYRRAVSQYGVPKEMLTDNGRQYTNWRGKTRFEQELGKDRIRHIKSSPHHPMTLGKVERFWKSIWEEFLCRAQFGSFEEAQERTRLWVQYYNHKRPHQGIGGLCPADRFYEIQNAVRQAVEQGIQDNILELALRGRPHDPFYMVGRLGEQSVVIRAEKGKLRMMVDGEDDGQSRELIYEMKEAVNDKDAEQRTGGPGPASGTDSIQRAGEMPSSAGHLGREAQTGGGLPGIGDSLEPAESVAGSGDGGYAQSLGAADENRGGEGAGTGPQAAATVGTQSRAAGGEVGPAGVAAGQAPGAKGTTETSQRAAEVGDGVRLAQEAMTEGAVADATETAAGRAVAPACRIDCAGTQRNADGRGGGPAAGSEPQNLLQVGAACAAGNDGGAGPASRWTPADAGG
jgi:hypothetical protein